MTINKAEPKKCTKRRRYPAAISCPAKDRPAPGYDFDQAKTIIRNGFAKVINAVADIHPEAMFNNYLVLELARQSHRLTKINYPYQLLRYLKLVVIGHGCLAIEPELPPDGYSPDASGAPIMVLAARKKHLFNIADKLDRMWPKSRAGYELACLENVQPVTAQTRLQHIKISPDKEYDQNEEFMVILYPTPQGAGFFPQKAFQDYASGLGFKVEYIHNTRGLRTLKVKARGSGANLRKLAEFTFIRHILPSQIS